MVVFVSDTFSVFPSKRALTTSVSAAHRAKVPVNSNVRKSMVFFMYVEFSVWQGTVPRAVSVFDAAFVGQKGSGPWIKIPKNACKFKKIFRLTAEKADL